jgi:hypothetical protein
LQAAAGEGEVGEAAGVSGDVEAGPRPAALEAVMLDDGVVSFEVSSGG